MTRVPVVRGLGPGVGASTVATALHATERRGPGHETPPADIAVCAGDETSLRRAEAAQRAAVLLVVLVDNGPPPTRARQRLLEARHGRVVVLPYVPAWGGLPRLPDESATLLTRPTQQLSPALRVYTQGLRLAVAALLHTGVPARPQPPARPDSAPKTRRPARPASSALPAGRSPSSTSPPVLDDDALEAEVLAAVTSCHAAQPAIARTTEPPISADAHRPGTAPPPVAARAARTTAAAVYPSFGQAAVPGEPAGRPAIRARHRPVVGSVQVPAAKAGCG